LRNNNSSVFLAPQETNFQISCGVLTLTVGNSNAQRKMSVTTTYLVGWLCWYTSYDSHMMMTKQMCAIITGSKNKGTSQSVFYNWVSERLLYKQ